MARMWTLLPNPADEGVTRLWDWAGKRWLHDGTCWRPADDPGSGYWAWGALLAEHGPLSDEPPIDAWEAFGKAVDTVVVAALQEQEAKA